MMYNKYIEKKKEDSIMRKLVYKLANGQVVSSLKEAVASGENFRAIVENLPKEEPNMCPIRKQLRPIAR